MDVRCERCKTEYEFDDARVTEAGVTVKCTQCGHVFRVKKKTLVVTMPVRAGEATPQVGPAPSGTGDPASTPSDGADRVREWRVRQANGNVFSFRELTTLQKWIVERKVTREDEISLTGESWKRLGNIAELASFFQVVDEAQKGAQLAALQASGLLVSNAQAAGQPSQTPTAVPGGQPMPPVPASAPVPEPYLTPPPMAPLTDQVAPPRARRGGGKWIALGLLLGLAAGAYGVHALYWEPRERALREAMRAERLQRERAAIEARTREEARRTVEVRRVEEERAARARAQTGERAANTGKAAAPADIVTPPVVTAPLPIEPAPKPIEPRRDFDWYMRQGDRLREREKSEAALDAYARAAELEPTRAEPIAGRGLALLDMGSKLQAQAAFEQALRLNPRYGVAIMGLAETYRALGRNSDAIRWYERYLELLPNGPEASVARAAIRKLQG